MTTDDYANTYGRPCMNGPARLYAMNECQIRVFPDEPGGGASRCLRCGSEDPPPSEKKENGQRTDEQHCVMLLPRQHHRPQPRVPVRTEVNRPRGVDARWCALPPEQGPG